MNYVGGFESLLVWKEARSLKLSIYQLVKSYPSAEKFDLISQTVRASRSVLANISEGHGRFYYKENISFCRKSRGSLSELLNHLIDAADSGFIDQETLSNYRTEIEKLGKILNGYIRYLQNQSKSQE